MRQDPIPPAVADRLSAAADRLRAARRSALDEIDAAETEWEYAGRTWSWPAGEARTYFHELAPGEREVLDDLIAALGSLDDAGGAGETDEPSEPDETDETDETDGAVAEPGVEVVGVGTGRVAVGIPGGIADEPLVAKLARYGPSAEMGDGRPQNRRERRIWSTVGSHPFLPVLGGDDDGDWIVMPRADVPPDEDVREAALERVRAALAPHRDRFHFDELKPENVGAYRDRFWIVDYGRPRGEPLFVEPPDASGAAKSPESADSTDSSSADAGENYQDRSDKS